MITLRKLKSLPSGTRLRKTLRLIEGFEREVREGREIDTHYLLALLNALLEDIDSGEAVRAAAAARQSDRRGLGGDGAELWETATKVRKEAEALGSALESAAAEHAQLRSLNGVRHALLSLLAMEPGEWDLLPTATEGGAPARPRRLFEIAFYLEEIRSPFNLGSIGRSAEAFGGAGLILSPGVPSSDHPRARRASMGAFEELPLRRCPGLSEAERGSAVGGGSAAGEELPVFALEAGGTPVGEFSFPDCGICLLGSEELGLSPEALALADSSGGRCTIPLYGHKGSLNVGVAAGILLSYWTQALVARGQKRGPAEDRRSLFESLTERFCYGLSRIS